MPAFSAFDGTKLAYHVVGDGMPMVCLPGGPMLDSTCLGDLGGLSRQLRLILLDYRGTGESDTPTDTLSYRCDHLVNDVEALRAHLGLDRMNLLGHCAGTNLAVSYAVRHPERVDKLVLITPSMMAVGIITTSEVRREVVQLRQGEPWFAPASAAFEAIAAGQGKDEDWAAITPFTYGRWDDTARAHDASMTRGRNEEAAAAFGTVGAFDPEATRASLATFSPPVLLVAGELDVAAAPRVVSELAGLFPNATLATQPGCGHFPWLDDATSFTTTVARFVL